MASPSIERSFVVVLAVHAVLGAACGDDEGMEEVPTVLLELRVGVPRSTPADAEVFVQPALADASDETTASAEAVRMERSHPLGYELTLEVPEGQTFAWRFTRGSDDSVEVDRDGAPVPPRAIVAERDRTLDLVVQSWLDAPRSPFSTARGNVRILEVPSFLEGRPVWVYLPPGYNAEPDRTYPVLYMLDGQNVFDFETSFVGEWRVDEACERLIENGEIAPLIVVAVENGRDARIDEYTPWLDDGRQLGGGGEAHLDAIVNVLMPYVAGRYRVRSGPEHTGFSGSSLGGLMSVYAAYRAPETFGRIGAVSPSIWWADRELLTYVDARSKPDVHLWVDMGTREGDDAIDDLRALGDLLDQQGFVEGEDLRVVEDRGGQHNESTWAERVPDILRFLFPPEL